MIVLFLNEFHGKSQIWGLINNLFGKWLNLGKINLSEMK